MKISLQLSGATADALTDIVGHVGRENVDYPTMAWLWFVAQKLPDTERYFPKGKWATIQHLEEQLRELAQDAATEFALSDGSSPQPGAGEYPLNATPELKQAIRDVRAENAALPEQEGT